MQRDQDEVQATVQEQEKIEVFPDDHWINKFNEDGRTVLMEAARVSNRPINNYTHKFILNVNLDVVWE